MRGRLQLYRLALTAAAFLALDLHPALGQTTERTDDAVVLESFRRLPNLGNPANSENKEAPFSLVLREGRPLSVTLDKRVMIGRVGQPIVGTVTESVYVYDRIVVPAGATISGRVAKLESPSKASRAWTMAGGDFTPRRRVVIEFDTLILPDGQRRSIDTAVTNETGRVGRQVAGGTKKPAKTPAKSSKAPPSSQTDQAKAEVVSWAKQELERKKRQTTQRVTGGLAAIRQPDRMERLREALLNRLPYHPQFLNKGTTYTVEMTSPLDFGVVTPSERAPVETAPAPDGLLNARLVTAVDSSKTPRGTSIKAVLTQPVFSAANQLILPEGAELAGEVTFAKKAGRLRRNGHLRFLFESVSTPDRGETPLLASLNSVDAIEGDHIVVEEEGGVRVTNSKTRFIEPALSALLLREALSRQRHRNPGGGVASAGTVGIRGVGGAIGFGTIGAVLSQFSAPAAIAFGTIGSARTFYTNVFGKGTDVSFQADTPIQLKLAPGPLTAE